MRRLMCVLFLVLFCSVQMTSSAPHSSNVQLECCLEFSNVRIPVKLVVSYYWISSSSSCPKQAIVFKTIAGRQFCVDPESAWVSGHVDKVDKRTTAATETNATAAQTQSPTV